MLPVFRTILKKYNLAAGDFPDIQSFAAKLNEVKFAEFNTLSQKQIEELDIVLNTEIPALMAELPSERDTPETLRAKMSDTSNVTVPIPTNAEKFGKKEVTNAANPFGFDETDETHFWALQESADRLRSTFESLGPTGGYLSTEKAREVLVRTGLEKDQLRQIWNLSDIDRDGLFDHEEYVVAMFLCDAVIQKGRPIPSELPASVVPPGKREIIAQRKRTGL